MGCHTNTLYIRHREEGTPYVNHVSPLKNLKATRPSMRICERVANIDEWDRDSFQTFIDTLCQPHFETGLDTDQTVRHRLPHDQDGCHKICLWSNEEGGEDLRLFVEACNSMWPAKYTDGTKPDVADLVQPLKDWARRCRPHLLGATTVSDLPPRDVKQKLTVSTPTTSPQRRPWRTDGSWRSPAKEESQGSSSTPIRRTMADVDRRVETPCRLTVSDYRRLNSRLHEGSPAVSSLQNGAFTFLNPREASSSSGSEGDTDQEGYPSTHSSSPVTSEESSSTSSHGLPTLESDTTPDDASEHSDNCEPEFFEGNARPTVPDNHTASRANDTTGSGAYPLRSVFESRLMRQQQIPGKKQAHWHRARALWAGKCDVLPPLARPFQDFSLSKGPLEEGGIPPAEEPSPFGAVGDGRPRSAGVRDEVTHDRDEDVSDDEEEGGVLLEVC